MRMDFLRKCLIRYAVVVTLAGLAWAPSPLLAQEKGLNG